MEKEELAYRYQLVTGQIEEAKKQLLALERTAVSLLESIKVLENLPAQNSLFGLNGGVYIEAEKVNDQRALTAMGAGVYTFKQTAEAIDILKKRLSEVERASELIRKSLEQLLQQRESLEETIQ